MASFDFQGALASGATPQAITSFLSSQGQGQLAQTYFNMNPTPAAQANNNPGIALSLLKSLAQPFTEAVGTGVRAIQATPKLAGAVGDAITGNKTNMQTNLAAAQQTMAKPILGENTFAGNTPEQNLGQAAKAASFVVPAAMGENAIGPVFTAAEGAGVGGLQNAGEALNQNQSAPQVAGAFVKGAGAGAALGVGGEMAIKGVGGLQDAIANASDTAGKTIAPEQSQQVALDAIKNPLSKDEQMAAVKRGRLSPTSTSGINPTIEYTPSKQEIGMAQSLKPMVEDGRILPPTSAANQEQNILQTGQEISTQADQLRQGLQQSDATAQAKVQQEAAAEHAAFDKMSPSEQTSYKAMAGEKIKANTSANKLYLKQLGTELDSVKIPDPVKNEPTLARNVASLKEAAKELYRQIPDRGSEAILDLKQNFDDYVQQNYGKTFFDKGRNADPFHSYVYSLRDKFTQLMADRLPEGTLPNGVTLKDSFLNQHNLINAQDEMAAKFTREYPEGTTKISRFIQAHPMLRRFGMRTAMQIGAAATGLSLGVAAVKKAVSNVASGVASGK